MKPIIRTKNIMAAIVLANSDLIYCLRNTPQEKIYIGLIFSQDEHKTLLGDRVRAITNIHVFVDYAIRRKTGSIGDRMIRVSRHTELQCNQSLWWTQLYYMDRIREGVTFTRVKALNTIRQHYNGIKTPKIEWGPLEEKLWTVKFKDLNASKA